MKKKAADEEALKKAILAEPALKQSYAGAFEDAAKAQTKLGEIYKRYAALEVASRSTLMGIARDLVRLPAELEVPNEKRLREYRSSERAAREIVVGSQLTEAIVFMRTDGEKIAQAVFAVRGVSVPPDATFTLRLSVGVVKGYVEGQKNIPWATNFSGMYTHATGKEPYKLPPRWLAKKAEVKDSIPFNFVSTNDIIGGNSGSPVVNKSGEIVGLIFDGNISSLPNRFIYGETTQRAVSVDTAAMSEALARVYNADALVKELTGRK